MVPTSAAPSLEEIVDALAGKREGSQYRCLCPAHNGRSLIVGMKNNTLVFHCLGGCSQQAVLDALKSRSLWGSATGAAPYGSPAPARPPQTNGGAPHADAEPEAPQEGEVLEAEYDYRDADGTLIATKGRFKAFSGKNFRWRRAADDTWAGLHGLKECDLPLYCAHLLAESTGPVWFHEGEKGADRAREAGLVSVCLPGGAATRNFGQALQALKGRDVLLVPDNDDAGCALMHRLADALQDIAKSVRLVKLDVPERGDAFDYFEAGGTAEALLEAVEKIRTKPWIDKMPDGYLVSIPVADGVICFEFTDLGRSRQGPEAYVKVWQQFPGDAKTTYSAHLNYQSISNREAFRRALDEAFGKEGGWTQRMNIACELVRQAEQARDDSVLLVEAPTTEVAYLLPPYVLAEDPTCIFAKGGSGKSYLALAIAAHIALGLPFLGRPVQQTAVLYLDYESSASVMQRRLKRILAGMGMSDSVPAVFYWGAGGVPLNELVPALRRKIGKEGIGLIVVDSAILAAGADPERAETAARYGASLSRLAIPSLTISHVTKKDDDQYPFGSIYWSNTFRSTFNLKLNHTGGGEAASIGVFHRKVNDEALEKPMGVRITFGDAVTFEREDLDPEWEKERSHADRIRAELRQGKCSVKELATALDLGDGSIRSTLRRMNDVTQLEGKADDGSKAWGLAQPA